MGIIGSVYSETCLNYFQQNQVYFLMLSFSYIYLKEEFLW